MWLHNFNMKAEEANLLIRLIQMLDWQKVLEAHLKVSKEMLILQLNNQTDNKKQITTGFPQLSSSGMPYEASLSW